MSISPPDTLHRFDLALRRSPVDRPDFPVARLAHLTRQGDQIVWQDLPTDRRDIIIAEEAARAREAGITLEWKLYSHDTPAGLPEALEAAGFVRQPTETVMVRLAQPVPIRTPEGLEVGQVETLEDATACFELLHAAFGSNHDASAQSLLDRASGGEVYFLGRWHGTAVSCGRIDTVNGGAFAGLYGGASHPDFRRRGFYRPVVEARCALAARLGKTEVYSEALPTSRPILEQAGFEPLCTVTGFVLETQ